jgi:hypothetical protein
MKECNRYLDFLERSDSSCDSAEWQDILAHAAQCPDCSTAMKNRGAMMEKLSCLDEPEYPANMHQRIIKEVEEAVKTQNSGFNFIDGILDKFLKPIEIGFSLACIVMIFSLITAETRESGPVRKKVEVAYNRGMAQVEKVQPQGLSKLKEKNKLQEVSKEEIEEFLVRLNRFNRMHDHKKQKPGNEMPELKLVNDWK